MPKQTAVIFRDQAYFTPADIITWMKFYILSEDAFRESFPEAYGEIASNFFWDHHLGYGGLAGDSFNLDNFLSDGNIDTFLGIVAGILDKYSLSREEIYTKVIYSEKLKEFETEEVNRLLAENMYFDDPFAVRKNLEIVMLALQKRSFYNLSDIRIEDLAGEWISTAETSALDYNYNMTDFMALGSRVRLLITKYDEKFYMSTWLVRVLEYTTREEREFAVRETYVILKDGYLSHYYKGKEGFDFSFRSPVFNYENDSFETQFWDVGFKFQRKRG